MNSDVPNWKSHKQRKHAEQNKKVHEKFLAHWKTDDKEWMKQRRKDWKNIQIQLDRMRDNDNFAFNSMKKKDYKFYKNYFLTGKETPESLLEKQSYCLSKYTPGRGYILFQFWLCPDHSVETLEYIKNNTYLTNGVDGRDNNNLLFQSACMTYRRTTECYSGSYKWTEEEGTTAYNGPIFGDLEPKMMELFAFDSESIKVFEDMTLPVSKGLYSTFEGVLLGFLEDFKPKFGVLAGYNPHNPILNLIDEYIRWGFPKKHDDSFSKSGKVRAHIVSYALILYVVDTPDGRPEKQLEIARELKRRITEVLPDLSEEANTRWDTAVKYYKEGGLKTQLIDYKL